MVLVSILAAVSRCNALVPTGRDLPGIKWIYSGFETGDLSGGDEGYR